jgi:hypothetical protein
MRRLVIIATITVAALAAVPAAAGAAKTPTAKQLVVKLVKARLCSDIEAVDAQGATVVCHASTSVVRVNAFHSKRVALKALDATKREACALLASLRLPTADQVMTYAVGSTWYVASDARFVTPQRVAKALGGKANAYRCV